MRAISAKPVVLLFFRKMIPLMGRNTPVVSRSPPLTKVPVAVRVGVRVRVGVDVRVEVGVRVGVRVGVDVRVGVEVGGATMVKVVEPLPTLPALSAAVAEKV